MGCKVRRVPSNWEHPRYTEDDAPSSRVVGEYRPCYDKDYKTAANEWMRNFDLWREGKHPDQGKERCKSYTYYWEYDSPPDKSSHRPAFTEEPTWYQVYETVSAGSPVTPPFPTLEKLADYLSAHGDFWYQKSVCEGRNSPLEKPTREEALAFVRDGSAISLLLQGHRMISPYSQALALTQLVPYGNRK